MDNGESIAAPTVGGTSTPVTILAVDDDPTSRMLARAALQDHFGEVVEAENGLAAVQALERQHFDLAIVDLHMPVMDGFEVIERARARPETRHLPLIVVTGRDDVVAIERAFALGATSFLCKPINWNVFRHQVGYVLQVARSEREARAAKERAERLAFFRERAVGALAREVERAVAKIAFLAGKGAAASLADIFITGERLQTVLKRLRRGSEVITGTTAFQVDVQEPADLARQAVQAVGERLGRGAAERVELQVAARQEVLCDRALVDEALEEVLANALINSAAGERVRFNVVDAPQERVRFEIEDRGSGIPDHMLEAGFEPFALHSGAEERGIGLGLAMAKAILDRHGGHFGIMSETGRGTEVFLSFPARSGWEDGEGDVKRLDRMSGRKLSEAANIAAS
jgi:two-component system sensor histidine kinase/response regulator